MYFGKGENELTVLLVYVDDILYVSSSPKMITDIRDRLRKSFNIKDLGIAKFCLGIEIRPENDEIHFSQRRFKIFIGRVWYDRSKCSKYT